jgi:hypothetical protein
VEELSLTDVKMRRFMSVSFDFASANHGRIDRDIFEVRLKEDDLARLQLGEGRAMRCWHVRDIPSLQVIPADRTALDFHAKQRRANITGA